MPNVTSAAGDCFNRIAKANGFHNYLTVYNYSDNATNFPNPNQLTLGSTVKVPEKTMQPYTLTLDGKTKFKIIRKKCKLKVKLVEADVSKVPGTTSVQLTLGSKKTATAAGGVMELDDIDPNDTAGTLTITLTNPAAYQKAPDTPAAVANQYPPRVVPADFDDPATLWPKKGETITWTLEVGSLEPQTNTKGVLQRLQNLGFTTPVQAAEDDDNKRAVQTYRRFVENLAPPNDTKLVADIRDNIKSRHDD